MFSNLAIDVALGLIFIYLLYSLLASVVQEFIARMLNARARGLTKGLRRLLEGDPRRRDHRWFRRFTFFNWFYELGWSIIYFFAPFKGSPFLEKFYNSPSIRHLGENTAASRPAYISPSIFSQAIIHLLRSSYKTQQSTAADSPGDPEMIYTALQNNYLHLAPDTQEHLQQLFEDAAHDIKAFRVELEGWFNETMTRASGWYRRQTQTWLLCLGMVIAAVFNVDSIAIARILMKDKNVRTQLVQLAASRVPAYTAVTDTLISKHLVHKDSSFYRTDTSLRVFVNDTSLIGIYAMLRSDAGDARNVLGISRGCVADSGNGQVTIHCGFTHPLQQNRRLVWAGWALTALALSLGAPFWFDLLGKIVKFSKEQRTQGAP